MARNITNLTWTHNAIITWWVRAACKSQGYYKVILGRWYLTYYSHEAWANFRTIVSRHYRVITIIQIGNPLIHIDVRNGLWLCSWRNSTRVPMMTSPRRSELLWQVVSWVEETLHKRYRTNWDIAQRTGDRSHALSSIPCDWKCTLY